MQIAAYVRVSTDDQNEQRQMRAIRAKYDDDQEDNQIEWYCDLGESGASTSRQEYQRLRESVVEYDVVVAHELDRLGRSFADLAGFVDDLREKGIDIDLVNHPIGAVGEDDWIAKMMGLWGTVSRADVARLLVAAPFTPAAADTTLEVVHNPLLRRRSLDIDWQLPR
jgi:DNA invertase Pin-like site-specific DNA recombinase